MYYYPRKNNKIDVEGRVFPSIHDDICDYNTQCFMYVGLIYDDIIMNVFMNTI